MMNNQVMDLFMVLQIAIRGKWNGNGKVKESLYKDNLYTTQYY